MCLRSNIPRRILLRVTPPHRRSKRKSAMPRKVILISGGSRGLGAALSRDFFESEWTVATFSRQPSPMVEELKERDPDQTHFYWEELDASSRDGMKAFVMRVMRRFGRLDALVNNAAAFSQSPLPLEKDSQIRKVLTVNLESTLLLTRACVRAMLGQGSGSIVNISSLNAVSGHPGLAVYSATKAALDGMTRSLARELGPRGIRVNSVAPGYFASEMSSVLTDDLRSRIVRRTPLRRLGTAEDVARAVRFLISDEATFITGQTLVVDGGVTC
jgi:3-oxoacyl-[acyl-carrier protein] reductase